MKKKFLATIVFAGIVFCSLAQNLQNFTATLITKETDASNYLSITNKKAYTRDEAKKNKGATDLALVITKNGNNQLMQWYNMSGKDEVIPVELLGTKTLINGISLDKEQFDKCKTTQDLKRMTGHITTNSLSHFASIGDNPTKEVTYHCFIIQLENGKRALLWLTGIDGNSFKVMVKVEA